MHARSGEMIALDEVTKSYGSAPARGPRPAGDAALREISLRIARGEVCAVVGPNGAGKTTLFGLVLGFLEPSAGSVRIDGVPPRRYTRRHGAAYLPERFRLPADWTVAAALRALARLEGLDRREAARRADALLERFALVDHADRRIGALSRGLLQRLGLAQTLIAERELVVLDEPTDGLDPLWRVRFRDLVEELRREGRTILIASHDLAEVERLAERAVLLDNGAIREIIPTRRPEGEATLYRIELASPSDAVALAFPNATPADPGAGDAAGAGPVDGGTTAYHIAVANESE